MTPLIVTVMQGPLCGTLATMLLYGVICMQTFHYANKYATSDRYFIKWLVGCIWVLETIHTGFSIHFIEYYLIQHYDDPDGLSSVVWTMGKLLNTTGLLTRTPLLSFMCQAAYISGFLVAWVVDLFFVWRIWKLSKQAIICTFLAVLATARTGIGIANVSLGFKYTLVKKFLAVVHPTLIAGWTLSAIADSLIAIVLCYHLHKQRSGMKRTDRIINTLLLYTINTALLTSFFAILIIVTFLAIPDAMDFTAFVQVQSKLYAVSVLASLNARKNTFEDARMDVPTTNRPSLPLVHPREGFDRTLPPLIAIHKDVEEETFTSTAGNPMYA